MMRRHSVSRSSGSRSVRCHYHHHDSGWLRSARGIGNGGIGNRGSGRAASAGLPAWYGDVGDACLRRDRLSGWPPAKRSLEKSISRVINSVSMRVILKILRRRAAVRHFHVYLARGIRVIMQASSDVPAYNILASF